VHARDTFHLLEVFIAPDGLKNYMERREDTISALLVTLQQEVLMFQDRTAITALQQYLADPSIPADWRVRGANLLTISGMYTRVHLPDDQPRDYLHVINTVGSERFVPDPVLMIYSVFPREEEVTARWHAWLEENRYQHALLAY
jgi:hypothetical protein